MVHIVFWTAANSVFIEVIEHGRWRVPVKSRRKSAASPVAATQDFPLRTPVHPNDHSE